MRSPRPVPGGCKVRRFPAIDRRSCLLKLIVYKLGATIAGIAPPRSLAYNGRMSRKLSRLFPTLARLQAVLCAGLLAATPLQGLLDFPVYHAHGGRSHAHADGGYAHGHALETAHPSAAHHHHHRITPKAASPETEAHRREHALMSREDILARMVRVQEEPAESKDHARAQEHSQPRPADDPLLPAPAPAAPDHSEYCSFSQPVPEADGGMAWQPLALAVHAPKTTSLPAPALLLAGVRFGRAPPAA